MRCKVVCMCDDEGRQKQAAYGAGVSAAAAGRGGSGGTDGADRRSASAGRRAGGRHARGLKVRIQFRARCLSGWSTWIACRDVCSSPPPPPFLTPHARHQASIRIPRALRERQACVIMYHTRNRRHTRRAGTAGASSKTHARARLREREQRALAQQNSGTRVEPQARVLALECHRLPCRSSSW